MPQAIAHNGKNKSSYSLSVIWNTIRHGLFFQGLRHALAKIGIDIMPYYWVAEEVRPSEKPVLRSESDDFEFTTLNESQVQSLLNASDHLNQEKINISIADGQECIGLIQNGTVAAYMFIKYDDLTFKNKLFRINSDEAYLLNMYVFDDFRGKNLAPFLRYLSYRYLDDKGIHKKYSISNYFNKSAIRFKEKLNSRHLKLYMNIELFKKFQWHFVLRRFK